MGLAIHEEKMQCHDGLLIGRDIIIREDLPTLAKKTDSNNRRQEHKARLRAARMRVPLEGLAAAFDARCRNSYEIAEFLDVSEDTLRDALELYRETYGPVAVVGDFVIRFEPRLCVYKVIMFA